jgi:outer membrane protein|tara:strand:- start:22738 stop:23283 length:546 start_codon:yes stop_codon:yes gene_type:complete
MKNNKLLVLTILVVLAIVIGSFAVWNSFQLKTSIETTAFVNLTVLFDRFEMKKEFEAKLKNDLSQKQNELDSLLFQLQGLNNKLSSTEKNNDEDIMRFQQMQNYYIQQKKSVEEYSYTKTQQYDSQILEQLTQYVKDYGEQKKYDYIYGLNNNGNLMYAKEQKDITEEVLTFINDKYQGKN